MPNWVPQFITGLILGIIAYFLKRYDNQQTKRSDDQDKRSDDQQRQINDLNRQLQEFKLEASDRYVHKDDFIRAMATTDRKLDKIYEEILKLNQKGQEARS